MLKYLSLILLFSPLFLFSQNAFDDTSLLIEYDDLLKREDLPLLLEIYEEKTEFDASRKIEVEQILQFVEDPFRDDFDYDRFAPLSLLILNSFIMMNDLIKSGVSEHNYYLILECDDSFPEDYDTFLNDDKIILIASVEECFIEKYDKLYPKENKIVINTDTLIKEPTNTSNGGAPSSSPPVNITTKIIDATSQFLVDRVKEELLLAFFDRFSSQVGQSTELTSLLPSTYFLLKNNDVFKIPSMGEVWMTAFEEDLNTIPKNLHLMVQSHPDYRDLKKKPEMQLMMMAGFVFNEIQEETELKTLLESFYEEFKETDSQLIQMFGVTELLRKNLINLSPTSTDKMVSMEAFRKLLGSNENASLYFSALIYQQDQALFNRIKIQKLGSELVLGDLMKTKFVDFTKMMGKFLTKMTKLERSKLEFDNKKSLKIEQKEKYQESVLEYANSFFEFLDYTVELAYFSNPDLYYSSSYFKTYRPVAQKTIQAIDAGNKEDYGQLMIYSMQMLVPLVQVRIDYLEKKLEEGDNSKIQKEIKTLEGVVKNFMYYGGFMVDVLSANSTQEIKGIINKYAAPVGSYRVKRQSPFSVSLSAYPGLYGGWETTYDRADSESFVTGVTAPIGLSLNWGNSFFGVKAKGHSFSLYAPIVDIGAAFSYRWSNSEGEGFPEEIKWQQVLSPGMHAVWGIGNTPMALMLGAQYTPLLRKITDQNNELQANAWRFGATIAVDIPIFHFYHSDK